MDSQAACHDDRARALGRQTVILDPSAARSVDAPITVALPSVHLAGSDAYYDAHIEVGRHGFALFLSPSADCPALDIDGTREQLVRVVQELLDALMSRP